MRPVLFMLFFLASLSAAAQPVQTLTSSEIYQRIRKLNVLGSVLYIAAHPDDENTRLIAFLSNEKLYRTAYLSLTRGDGGQNLIGDEQGVDLGLIRTQELLAARRIDGGEQFFSRAFDFGYSKTPEETLEFWDKEKVLSDVVWIIRKFRPDVVITRFPETGEGGHGHHTASAILARMAFEAAGDSTRFAGQLQHGVRPWQPHRLLWNTYSFGSTNTIRDDQFKIDAGGYNPLLGQSYGELAAISRSQHKSQGFGVSASRGIQFEHFETIKGSRPDSTLFDGVDVSWGRIGGAQIGVQIESIISGFSFAHPERSVDGLLHLYKSIDALPPSVWKEQKLAEVKNLLLACSGLYAEVFSSDRFGIRGNDLKLTFSATNRTGLRIGVENISFGKQALSGRIALPAGETVQRSVPVHLADSFPLSQPYWLKEPVSAGSFSVAEQRLIGQPENDPVSLQVTFHFDGQNIAYDLPVRYKANDPVKGEVIQPLFIIPAVEVRSVPEVALSVNGKPVRIGAGMEAHDTTIRVEGTVAEHSAAVKEERGSYAVSAGREDVVKFSAQTDRGSFNRYKVLIEYPHIPDIIRFATATSKLVGADLKVSGKTAGYIPGAGDKIPEALQQMGYMVTVLDQQKLFAANLQQYDVIITGVRAYNVHHWLNDAHSLLMEYVKNGGVLFVQYNTNNNLGPVKARIGPYPFDISRVRVSKEDAPVRFTDPDNTLMRFPNMITSRDFEGWVQERSIYHAAAYEANYRSLFSMHDPGEQPGEGGLIYCNYGKGRFIYSGVVFFRQLPAGNQGAYRLFANLIARPK